MIPTPNHNRIWGLEVDQIAYNQLKLDVNHYTVTASSSVIQMIDITEDLQSGYRLVALSSLTDPEEPRQFAIVDLSSLGFK